MTTKEKILVLGGGFAGLNLVKKLDKEKYDVALVDRHNYHAFPPLFYQVASSELDPTSICFPLRREFGKRRGKGVRFHIGDVKAIDVANKQVITNYENIPYDKLVIALGTTNNFFGNPDLINEVYTLKSTDEAIRIRNEILFRCERAAVEQDEEKRRRMLSFIVIGGGPAGVEIAGAIGELKRYILKRDYPEIPIDDLSITIIEGTDRLLGAMSPEASATALRDLGQLMVNVKLGRLMKTYKDNIVTLDDGSTLYSEMVIWTAGVTGTPIEFIGSDYKPGRGARYPTDDYCRVKGLDDIYAIGDINFLESEKFPRGLPQLAQVAIQQGKFLAENFNRDRWDKPFRYKDKGSMATIGRNRAVADINKIHLNGFLAWMAWMFIHLISLLGMRSKLSVLINWIWAYFSYNTALRLLLFGAKYPRRGSMWDKG
ncbi:NAD(P)/FAD-dependent oxidoreductase [uncultured Duncaniella sp.]|uniref:NAD(P)/FAD-dependent oxidoreductase n=2 Tax=uncultured Duncaniella sp. TaxID=2768039 RepID=UPI0026051B23|nr:NAD(P)/FAD-dependent oxidoreductase [uncultured Duncaniella sp.]